MNRKLRASIGSCVVSFALARGLASFTFGQSGGGAKRVSVDLLKIRKEATTELAKLRALMTKSGCAAEAADCDAIAAKLSAPHEVMSEKEPAAAFPGDKAYDEVLAAWSKAGERLAKIYGDGEAKLQGDDRQEAELLKNWFATFPDLAEGIRHLNRRRKYCKLPPVTQDWSGSIGGYYHGLYLKLNKGDPSLKGLGSHNPTPGRPGWTPEGNKAAHSILAWGGSAPAVIDTWLNSRFHRDPVLNPSCGRVTLGGMPGGVYSCRTAGSNRSKPLGEIMTWPGDGDTDIPRTFSGELPSPFPSGITSSGTVIVVLFARGAPAVLGYELLDEHNAPVETLQFDKQPLCFAAKKSLERQTKYTVRIQAAGGVRHSFSFTTR